MLFGYGIYQQDMYKEKVCNSLPRYFGEGFVVLSLQLVFKTIFINGTIAKSLQTTDNHILFTK